MSHLRFRSGGGGEGVEGGGLRGGGADEALKKNVIIIDIFITDCIWLVLLYAVCY